MLNTLFTRAAVDTEQLMTLLNEQTEIADKPDATELLVAHGDIEFGMYLSPLILQEFFSRLSCSFIIGGNHRQCQFQLRWEEPGSKECIPENPCGDFCRPGPSDTLFSPSLCRHLETD
jgi:hypothetical protein